MESLFVRITSDRYLRWTQLSACLWLCLIYPMMNGFWREILPRHMRAGGSDFCQYYGAALAVRYDLWPQLYPQPRPEVYQSRPIADGSKSFVVKQRGAVGDPRNSLLATELLEISPPLEFAWRNVAPPPLGLLLFPLGYLDYTSARDVWFLLMGISLFGTGWLAGKIYRLLPGSEPNIQAVLQMLPVLLTLFGSGVSTLDAGNVSPLLGLLLAVVTYGYLRGYQICIAIGLIPMFLFKGLGLGFLPALLFKPLRLRTLGGLFVFTVLLNGVTLYLGGWAAYRAFFEILPLAHIPLGTGIQGMLLHFFGLASKPVFVMAGCFLLGLLYFGYHRACRAVYESASTGQSIALFSGIVAVFCLLNPIIWPHYFTIYLFLPFAGWLIWELQNETGRWRWVLMSVFVGTVFSWLDALVFAKHSPVFEWLQQTGFANRPIAMFRAMANTTGLYIVPFLATIACLVQSYRRLCFLTPKG